MSGDTEERRRVHSGWTLDTYAVYQAALKSQDDRFESMKGHYDEKIDKLREKFEIEQDRRYAEVATEREKALKIKETADLAALGLAREIQTYKDEKANELREQIGSERGLYATKGDLNAAIEKVEAIMKPLSDYVAADRGKGAGVDGSKQFLTWFLGIALALTTLYTFSQRQTTPQSDPVMVQLLQEIRTQRSFQQAPYVPATPGTMLPSPSANPQGR